MRHNGFPVPKRLYAVASPEGVWGPPFAQVVITTPTGHRYVSAPPGAWTGVR